MRLSTCTEWLLFHLWKSNPETGKSCPGLIIPETIIYRWAQPYFWYFTSNDGTIIRKTKDRISVDYIFQFFTQIQKNQQEDNSLELMDIPLTIEQENQICSTYMTSQPLKNDTHFTEKIEFEHFQNKDFSFNYLLKELFLYQRDKALSCILQKFISPYKDKNQAIKVTWTPQFCLFYRKTNIHNIFDEKVSLNERLITFGGSENLTIQVSPTLQKDIEHLCINIIRHIQEVSGGNIQISRMVLYMKVDYNNKLQLMYCTDLRIREKHCLQINNINLNIKKRHSSPKMTTVKYIYDNRVQYTQMNMLNIKGQIEAYKGKHCLYCKQLYDLTFNHIILSYEQDLMTNEDFLNMNPIDENDLTNRPNYATTLQQMGIDYKTPFLNEDQQTNQKNKKVPLFLEFLWGKLSQEQYDKLKENITWISLKTKVCGLCYMNFTVVSAVPQTEIQFQQTRGNQFQNIKSKIKFQYIKQNKETLKNQIIEKFKVKNILEQKELDLMPDNTNNNQIIDIKQHSPKKQKLKSVFNSKQNMQAKTTRDSQNLNENQRNYYNFKLKQKELNNYFDIPNEKNNTPNNHLLKHLKQLAHDHSLAKRLKTEENPKNEVQIIFEKPQQIKQNKIYKNKEQNLQFPKLIIIKKDIFDSFKTESTNDDKSKRQINHKQMMKTIQNLKCHLINN